MQGKITITDEFLAEFRDQRARCERLLSTHRTDHAAIEQLLRVVDDASVSSDLDQIVTAYEAMRNWK